MGICSAEEPAPAEAEKGQVGGAAIEGAGAEKGEAAAGETAAAIEPAAPADKATDAADKK